MALPGKEIRPKIKRQKKADTGPPGSARARLATLIDREAQASKNALSDDPVPNSNTAGPSNAIQEDEVDHDEQYDELITGDNLENEGNDPANVVPMNRSEYFRSVTYQERTLRAEAKWNAVIPKLFDEFLPCSQMTFQWGNPQLWNHDWNDECKCANWKIHEVVIDTIDIIANNQVLQVYFGFGTINQHGLHWILPYSPKDGSFHTIATIPPYTVEIFQRTTVSFCGMPR
ncbi:uncharacterized protein MELLADRAFT_85567 [Melampsora larici-populina 98AG31]|uniref:CxC1-like cysteine cluster associated with KDZ transposases domain-containing protein n=1 Tax=Melampsora larici-populina (strain 98AG31 / pathotype 3-4-7) TaxID=747676 RepID=F4RID5_MELLP|nr:uncharacterized protein MELLADRAFT_85567 [Melampsora larici-populina 98AG31]EGG07698.1 hypothetical protein MELLADRAFT_85567 [Melampsora larici-populina 98AG31]